MLSYVSASLEEKINATGAERKTITNTVNKPALSINKLNSVSNMLAMPQETPIPKLEAIAFFSGRRICI